MVASELLSETLATIAAERPASFDRSFGLAERLGKQYGEEGLAERLLADIPADCPPALIADLLDILAWITSDNGAAIHRQAETWLRSGENLRRIQVALSLEVYPFLDQTEMERILRQVATRHPEVAGRCQDLIASRRADQANGAGSPSFLSRLAEFCRWGTSR